MTGFVSLSGVSLNTSFKAKQKEETWLEQDSNQSVTSGSKVFVFFVKFVFYNLSVSFLAVHLVEYTT